MLAMQYSIHLPYQYDMGQIRERVNGRRPLFDGLRGLVHKAFMMNEAEKIYAPFYIWNDVAEARHFLMNDLFRGVVQSFSRPRVRHWTILQMAEGNRDMQPTFALREADIIAPEEALDALLKREQEAQAKLLRNPALYLHAIALDPDRWELLRYSVWKDEKSAEKPAGDCVQAYEVLHVSQP